MQINCVHVSDVMVPEFSFTVGFGAKNSISDSDVPKYMKNCKSTP